MIKKCSLNKASIEDLNITQLAERNQEDPYYDIKINDFGYVERISGSFSPVKVDSYETALYSLYSIRSAMGITDPFQELCPYDAEVDDTGYLFKFAQVYQGIKTFSNILTITADPEGRVDYFSSDYFPIEEAVDTTPAYTYEQAADSLRDQFGALELLEAEEEYCILNYCGHAAFVWEIACDLLEGTDDLEAGTYLFLVGGADGKVKYRNFAQNSASQRVLTSQDDMLDQERYFYITQKSQTEYILKDTKKKIQIYNSKKVFEGGREKKKKVKIVSGGKASWKKREVSAMANMSDIYEFYRDHFGRYSYNNGKTMQKGKKIEIVLDKSLINNCKWNDTKKVILVGDGDGIAKAEDGMGLNQECLSASADLICHEFTHAVMQKETALYLVDVGIGASINEAYADMAACFFDGNWEIAENSVVDYPLRDNAVPERVERPSSVGGKYYIDPICYLTGETDPSKIKDLGGVHINCTILTHAVYLMQHYGIPQQALEKIWYKTIRMGYNIRANFYTVSRQFVKACAKCGFDQYIAKVERAFREVNVTKANSDVDYSSYYLKAEGAQYSFAAEYWDSVDICGKTVDAVRENETAGTLEDVEISVLSMDSGEQLSDTVTEEDGLYEVSAATRDGYRLQYQCDGYLPEEMYLPDINALVQTEYYCDTVRMIPQGSAGKGNAQGTIRNALTTEGIGGITLKVRAGINNIYTDVVKTICTNADGSYVLNGLEAGSYCLEMVCGEDSEYISSYFNIVVLGKDTVENQDGILSSKLAGDQMRVVLTWGEKPRDLDAHLFFTLSQGGGGHIYYQNKEYHKKGETICALDVDDVTSYGPETVTIYSGKTSAYQYGVLNYSLEEQIENSGATVRVYMDGQAYPKYIFHVPHGDGKYWIVFEYNSATKRLIPVNELA